MKNTESSSIVVQWDEVDDSLPTTYIVTWTSERDHIIQSKTLEEQSSYTITGLTLDTVYTITVSASNICDTGPEYSISVSLTSDTTSTTSSIIRPTSTISTNSMNTSSTEDSGTVTMTSTVVTSTTAAATTSSKTPSTTANIIVTTSTAAVAVVSSSSIAGTTTINNPITATTINTIVSPTATAGSRNPADTTSKFKLILYILISKTR